MYTGRLRSEIPPSLKSLSLSMMRVQTRLVELDLSDNAFGPDGAEAIRYVIYAIYIYMLYVRYVIYVICKVCYICYM